MTGVLKDLTGLTFGRLSKLRARKLQMGNQKGAVEQPKE